jgi:preprotein translocase subunit SecA
MAIFNFLGKFLDSNEREVKKLNPLVEQVNSLEKNTKKLSDTKLRDKTKEFKNRLEKGKSLDDILPEAYALVREAAVRTIGQRHYDVQIIGGIVHHQGKITEMKTGEGKTLVATLPLYLNALEGKGAHLVTVNDYLSKRDAEWMGPIFHLLGLSVGVINHDKSYVFDPNPKTPETEKSELKMDPEESLSPEEEGLGVGKFLREVERKEAYEADITYGTNNEFGFDYLRDNMVNDLKRMVQRPLHYAIVDEVDSILIDEARTPLIISAPAEESTEKYYEFARIIDKLTEKTDYQIDEKSKTANLTEIGVAKVERVLGVSNLYEKDFDTLHHIEESLKAKTLYLKDRDYVVKEGEVIIVDEFTGRMLPGRRYSEGLHQAIEAKEGVQIQRESLTLATVTFQNYFRLYKKLAGMTGTAATSAEEFHKVYELDVIIIPTNEPMIRKDLSDKIYKTVSAKFEAISDEIKELHEAGQPMLVGTTSIEKNELLSTLLKRRGIPHEVLNAKNHEKEAQIITNAGQKNAVTIATNIAGRGVDIKLGKGVTKLGGLHIIGSERHEARRIDHQLRGRSGRQGDPGSTQFYVSLQDDIMRLFGGDTVSNLMNSLKIPDDVPIENNIVSKAIESAQGRVEGHNFDIRKRLVDYDDVLNKQREIIYSLRKKVLTLGDKENKSKEKAFEELEEMVEEKIDSEIEKIISLSQLETSEVDYERIGTEYFTILPFDEPSQKEIREKIKNLAISEKIEEELKKLAHQVYEKREEQFGKDLSREIEKLVLIQVVDTLWVSHLEDIDHLREGIGLRGYAGRDPLVEYKSEAFKLFENLMSSIDYEVVHRIFKIQIQPQAEQPQEQRQTVENKVEENTERPAPISSGPKKIGRNDPCPCGSGLKFKKCGIINSPKHQSNS